jgi:Fe2+ transport system protein FeoA
MPRLYDLEPGDVAQVALSGSMERAALSYLESLGLRPDAHVEVVAKQPFDGRLELWVGDQVRILGEKLARQIYVKRVTSG